MSQFDYIYNTGTFDDFLAMPNFSLKNSACSAHVSIFHTIGLIRTLRRSLFVLRHPLANNQHSFDGGNLLLLKITENFSRRYSCFIRPLLKRPVPTNNSHLYILTESEIIDKIDLFGNWAILNLRENFVQCKESTTRRTLAVRKEEMTRQCAKFYAKAVSHNFRRGLTINSGQRRTKGSY